VELPFDLPENVGEDGNLEALMHVVLIPAVAPPVEVHTTLWFGHKSVSARSQYKDGGEVMSR